MDTRHSFDLDGCRVWVTPNGDGFQWLVTVNVGPRAGLAVVGTALTDEKAHARAREWVRQTQGTKEGA